MMDDRPVWPIVDFLLPLELNWPGLTAGPFSLGAWNQNQRPIYFASDLSVIIANT
jgi:hypothetical protein